MHMSILRSSYMFLHRLRFFERYVIITIGMLLLVLAVGYSLYHAPDQQLSFPEQSYSQSLCELAEPLTLLDRSQYAHEYSVRAQALHDRLAMLREALDAERAYVFAYGKSEAVSEKYGITHVFEVVREGLRLQHQYLQGITLAADQVPDIVGYETYEQLPYIYGKPLHDSQNRVIGYFGIDSSESFALLQDAQIEHVRKTIAMIEATLSQP